MRIRWILALLGALSLPVAPVLAQDDLSVDEIVERLNAQKNAFRSVKTRGLGGGEARGLRIVEIEDVSIDENGQQVVVGAASPAQPTVPDASDSAATATAQSDSTASQQTPAQPSVPDTAQTVVTAAITDPNKPLTYGEFVPELQINLRIGFGFDSAALAASEKPKLQKMCLALQKSSVEKIRIVGHTDASGTEEYNERLSILRAREVARHLIEECGIAPTRLETVGLGERFPANGDDPKADENRRVEFQALS